MKRGSTPRGFAFWEFYNRDYFGEKSYEVSVQESSLATERKVWVGPSMGERMHLSEESARDLRDALTEWLEEGEGSGASEER